MTESQALVQRVTGRLPKKLCGCTTTGRQGCIWGSDEPVTCRCGCHYANRLPNRGRTGT
jgi:hypothetical protein